VGEEVFVPVFVARSMVVLVWHLFSSKSVARFSRSFVTYDNDISQYVDSCTEPVSWESRYVAAAGTMMRRADGLLTQTPGDEMGLFSSQPAQIVDALL